MSPLFDRMARRRRQAAQVDRRHPVAASGLRRSLPPLLLRANNLAAYADDASPELLLSGPAGSGKTLALLAKLFDRCEDWPGSRVLFVRKTRKSLTEAALVTWERDVVPAGHPILARPVGRDYRRQYRFPNGSEVVLGGMDNPNKVLSTEWDAVYCQEATELSVTDWEALLGRLRPSGTADRPGPRRQILADCNPTTPTHWLYKRCQRGTTRLYETTHRDNPRYWDAVAGSLTPAGEEYVAGTLSRLTGARRKRFLDGVWTAAEGLVYDGFDPGIHLHPPDWRPEPHWPRVWAIDWGFAVPTVLQFWAVDPEGRMYLYREFYRTHTRSETLAKWVKAEVESGREPPPAYAVCDHDPEAKANFEAHGPPSVTLTMADKGDRLGGIEDFQARFDVQADGRPRVYFVPDCVADGLQASLTDAGKPASTLEELGVYVWDTRNPDRPKDEPLKENDHGMDCGRYAARLVNQVYPNGGQADSDPYGLAGMGRPGGLPPGMWRP